MVDPFSILVAGSEDGSYSALSQSSQYDKSAIAGLVIMDHAGEIYVYTASDGSVRAYEQTRISPRDVIHHFDSFDRFVEWLVEEAISMRS
jgi:hypothetical protein